MMARKSASRGSALVALGAAVLGAALARQSVFVAPPGHSEMDVRPGRAFATRAPTATPQKSYAQPSSGLWAVAAIGVALSGLVSRRRGSQPASQPKVVMYSRSPFPSSPMGNKGKKRVRAGRKRPIFRGRQLAVRVNPNTNKPIRYRMHVKAGDTVQVMKGKDAGKVTEVLKTYPKWNKILCLGVNYNIKHVRPQKAEDVGQRVQVEAPMHSTCVMHYDEEAGVAGLLGIRFEKKVMKDGTEIMKKIRYNKATGTKIVGKKPQKWVPVLDRAGSDV
eukprot:TRINITY_DN1691_c1_g1_i1.p1 TRINITY_DN1691_c1_g1~~TRINITY_DN1691_c1_g1_i1.p1  ORF type:complete len:276 (-),score=32.63 TRINITY_DN1691_c1_g1_i1:165-992(-)